MNTKMNTKQTAGLLLFIGASQFFISMLIAEALYPNYNIAKNMISDLGVGPTAPIFNSSIVLLGGLILIASSRLHKCEKNIPLTAMIFLTGFGAIGVGLFDENTSLLHEISAGMTFIFGGIAEIYSSRLIGAPFSIIAIIMGCITLISLGFFAFGYYLFLGPGGTERMIVYPVLLWALGLGGYLMASEGTRAKK
jgi:hypothetical membrane protein